MSDLERVEVAVGDGRKAFSGRPLLLDAVEERPQERVILPDAGERWSVYLTAGGSYAVHVSNHGRPLAGRLERYGTFSELVEHLPVSVAQELRRVVPLEVEELDW